MARDEHAGPIRFFSTRPPSTKNTKTQNRFRAVGADVAEARAETLRATLAAFKDKLDAFAHEHR
jgi:hypothetical protein